MRSPRVRLGTDRWIEKGWSDVNEAIGLFLSLLRTAPLTERGPAGGQSRFERWLCPHPVEVRSLLDRWSALTNTVAMKQHGLDPKRYRIRAIPQVLPDLHLKVFLPAYEPAYRHYLTQRDRMTDDFEEPTLWPQNVHDSIHAWGQRHNLAWNGRVPDGFISQVGQTLYSWSVYPKFAGSVWFFAGYECSSGVLPETQERFRKLARDLPVLKKRRDWLARKLGFRTPPTRTLIHFMWTALYRVERWPLSKIAENPLGDDAVTAETVYESVNDILGMIGLDHRC